MATCSRFFGSHNSVAMLIKTIWDSQNAVYSSFWVRITGNIFGYPKTIIAWWNGNSSRFGMFHKIWIMFVLVTVICCCDLNIDFV